MAQSKKPNTAVSGAKVPPQNLDAEMSLLGAILIDEETLADISDKLRPNDFYDKRHVLIFDAMMRLYERHRPVEEIRTTHQHVRAVERAARSRLRSGVAKWTTRDVAATARAAASSGAARP